MLPGETAIAHWAAHRKYTPQSIAVIFVHKDLTLPDSSGVPAVHPPDLVLRKLLHYEQAWRLSATCGADGKLEEVHERQGPEEESGTHAKSGKEPILISFAAGYRSSCV